MKLGYLCKMYFSSLFPSHFPQIWEDKKSEPRRKNFFSYFMSFLFSFLNQTVKNSIFQNIFLPLTLFSPPTKLAYIRNFTVHEFVKKNWFFNLSHSLSLSLRLTFQIPLSLIFSPLSQTLSSLPLTVRILSLSRSVLGGRVFRSMWQWVSDQVAVGFRSAWPWFQIGGYGL